MSKYSNDRNYENQSLHYFCYSDSEYTENTLNSDTLSIWLTETLHIYFHSKLASDLSHYSWKTVPYIVNILNTLSQKE